MTWDEAESIVDSWALDERLIDVTGCIEDIVDGWDPVAQQNQIIERNTYTD